MKKSKKILKYDVVFEEAEEGGYTVYVPALSGCISEGDTFKEAKKNIAEAINLYLESLDIDSKSFSTSNSSHDLSVILNEVKNLAQA